MDLIRISDTKLKIMLTSSDMAQYDLHSDNISIADQHVRQVMRRLLAQAKEETGFEGDMARLYIQMYPCRDGGCELFISKPDTKDMPDGCCALPVLSSAAPVGKEMRVAPKYRRDECVYSFSHLDELIAACRRLYAIGFRNTSNAYVDCKHKYYLLLKDVPVPSLYIPDEYCFLGEYGSRENARSMQAYLSEYCTLIAEESAMQKLMQL